MHMQICNESYYYRLKNLIGESKFEQGLKIAHFLQLEIIISIYLIEVY